MTHVIEIPFHIGDFLGGTMHMDATEIGAYWMLCVAHYQAGSDGLPDDDVKLSRIAKVTPKVWKKIRPTIAEKFEVSDSVWRSKKVIEILLKISGRSSNAKANSLKRWNADHATALPRQCNGNPNLKPLTKDKEPPYPHAENAAVSDAEAVPRSALAREPAPPEKPFRIEPLLCDADRDAARSAACGWDVYHLMRLYDEGINAGKREVPCLAGKAFVGWVKAYTKGKSP